MSVRYAQTLQGFAPESSAGVQTVHVQVRLAPWHESVNAPIPAELERKTGKLKLAAGIAPRRHVDPRGDANAEASQPHASGVATTPRQATRAYQATRDAHTATRHGEVRTVFHPA